MTPKPSAEQAPSADPEYEQQSPSYAQLADWWLCGQLLADPTDLLRGLLDEYRALERERGAGS